MVQVGVRDLNQKTSHIIARVRAGETIDVTDRGRLVARLVPVQRGQSFLEQLVAEGRATPPEGPGGPIQVPPPLGDPDVDVAAELTAARDEERW